MATKKPAQKTAAKKPIAKKASTTTAKTTTTVTRVETTRKAKKVSIDTKLPADLINIVIAEIIGTFILAVVAISATSYFMLPFYVGLALAVMIMAVGAVSGSHINPAVTFGLWATRKVKTILVPFYWAAQFLGAMAAVVLLGTLSNGSFTISFNHFMEFSWGVFTLELIGTAIFIYGLVAVVNRKEISSAGKAIGIGMSLTIALLATTALYPYIQRAAMTEFQAQQEKAVEEESKTPISYPHEAYVSGATLNPAVALVVTELSDSQLQGSQSPMDGEKSYTRLSLEVILATLIGAALGGNLFLLVNHRNKD